MRRVLVTIKGQVQGVFFRAGIAEHANKLKINGWVKNSNNDVEAVFEGKDDTVAEMLEFCLICPKGAKVKSLEIDEEPYVGDYNSFEIEE